MIWQKIHRWVSVALGAVVFVVCLTGALLAFQRELTEIFASDPSGRSEFFMTVRSLHTSLGLGRPGRLIVGISVIGFVIILISGLAIWLRRVSLGGLRRNLNLRLPTPLRGFHIVPGVCSLAILLLCALTGLTWSFGYRDAFYFLFDGLTEAPLFHTVHGLHTGSIGGTALRVLWCLACLVGASLPLTGYWIFIRRKRPKRRRK